MMNDSPLKRPTLTDKAFVLFGAHSRPFCRTCNQKPGDTESLRANGRGVVLGALSEDLEASSAREIRKPCTGFFDDGS
ncbi:hypothetical protein GL4_0380 [Methyloceanibacter caenitepidi]|uniref:Uncharacterized protein n=1 Tax=Methyloceanibacter caenitepidi TaxID=1384459 RepID=A0A0A8JYG7_9HYPH|nr:hypothetical protein GL4_0380 [Methyloceanibacter caenitepidi]